MLLVKQFNVGDLSGSIYDFEKVGDVVPKHVHDEKDTHITIVTKGRLKASSHDWEIEAVAGQILDFRAGEPHELMALEDNTRILNLGKKFGGVPNDSVLV